MNHHVRKSAVSKTIVPFPGNRRFFFGHQSVGSNVLDGIRLLSPMSEIYDIGNDRSVPGGNGVFHAELGKNADPYSKIDDFDRIFTRYDSQFDIALMKFCYVDISAKTDIFELFEYYRTTIRSLQTSLPDTLFIHSTVPLRCVRLGIRSRLRQITGRPIGVLKDCFQIEAYNVLIRNEYRRSACLFDIAMLESTALDGSEHEIKHAGQYVRTMCSDYSADGGHLNTIGKRLIAGKLIDLIDSHKSE